MGVLIIAGEGMTRCKGRMWVFLLITGAAGAIMHESVLLHKMGDFSMSRSNWLVSFVIDLSIYERFLDKLTQDINKVAIVTNGLLDAADTPRESMFRTDYEVIVGGLREEMLLIHDIHSDVVKSFDDYKLLKKDKPGQQRRKRKVFGFIGDLMGDVFGVVTEKDLVNIQKNIRRLAGNQEGLSHVVEESLSIINVSRIEIGENRQKLNDIITTIGSIEDEILNISSHLEQEVREVKRILKLFARLNVVIAELKLAITRSMNFYTQFQLQIQAVTMQRLSPTTIPARILRSMLLEISGKLPQTVGLPRDPHTHLFDYYKYLHCVPIFDGKHIMISIKVPLVEYSQQYDLFRAYSLPVPLLGRTRVGDGDKRLLAYYKLESDYLAINSDRSNYVLLTENQVQRCGQSGLKICNIKSPIRKTNTGQNCLLSNFNQNKSGVKKFCKIWLRQTPLPTAFYLSNDVYLIIVERPTIFHLSCKPKGGGRKQIGPPGGFLTLHKSCQATSSYFSLMGYFEGKTVKSIDNPANVMLREYNISNIGAWDDINNILSSGNKTIKIPKKLTNIKDFSLNNLMDELHQSRQIEPMVRPRQFPVWAYMIIFIVVVFILLYLASCLQRHKQKLIQNLPCLVKTKKPNPGKSLTTQTGLVKGSKPGDGAMKSLSEPERAEPLNRIIREKFVVVDSR